MKSFTRQVVAFCVGAALATAAVAQEKIRIAGNFAGEHSSSVAVEKVFRTELAKLTNGQLGVDVFPAMQLGGAKENVDAVRSGALFMTWVGVGYFSRIIPELEAISIPFQFTGREQAFKVVDGPVGQLIDKKYGEKGFISLGWMEIGPRHLTNSKKPVKTLEDLKGMKIRVQPLEPHLAMFRALGANAIAMDVKELYSAMQQGVVEGQENPYAIINANRYSEVQKFLSSTGHAFDFIAIVANRKQFEAMKPETQKAIRTAMAATVAHQRKLAAEQETEALAELRKKMQYEEISPQVREQMRKASAGVVEQVKKRVGAAFVDQVYAEIAKVK